MFNAEKPSLEELPSSRQLVRSTVIAAVSAVVLLVTVILPAEYGIDPTGIVKVLGLAEMGEIKRELSDEAERDHGAALREGVSPTLIANLIGAVVGRAEAQEPAKWKDEIRFDLKPGDTRELKLTMKKGGTAAYRMVVEGGRVNFDLHAHGGGRSTTHIKGRGSRGAEGEIVAAFDGDHGWFWRNRDCKVVTVTLMLRGAYGALKQGH